jgi:hypothetical protein
MWRALVSIRQTEMINMDRRWCMVGSFPSVIGVRTSAIHTYSKSWAAPWLGAHPRPKGVALMASRPAL